MSVERIVSKIVSPSIEAARIKIGIKSQLSPDFVIDVNEVRKKPITHFLLRLAKPEITVRAFNYTEVITPWGEPKYNYIPIAVAAGVITLILIGYVGYQIGIAVE